MALQALTTKVREYRLMRSHQGFGKASTKECKIETGYTAAANQLQNGPQSFHAARGEAV